MATKYPNGRYTDIKTLRENRQTKLRETKRKCELCKEPAKTVHHLDKTKHNHSLNNLMILCKPCHLALHPNVWSQFRSPEIRIKIKITSLKDKIKVIRKQIILLKDQLKAKHE